jgi:iron complex transport system substrate-binding protein
MKIVPYLLVLVILTCWCVPLAVMPTGAQELVVPGDKDGDKIVSEDELADSIMAYLKGEYLGENVEHQRLDTLREAAHIHVYYPRTITDSADRKVTIYMPIKRAITLTSDSAEGIRILGAVDNIIGVTDTIKVEGKVYFPELLDKPSVGTWKEFNFEKIVELVSDKSGVIIPDIIVISYVNKVSGVEDGLSPFHNIAVLGLDLYKSETLEDELIKLGYIIEREDGAQDFVTWCSEKENAVRNAVYGHKRPKVYIEKGDSIGTGELGTYGEGSALDELCEIAGGDNIAKGIAKEYPKVDWEWVTTENPDIIIKSEPKTFLELTGDAEEIREEVMNRIPRDLSAIRNGKVYVYTRKITYGLESVVGLTYWAKIFYPDTSLDPEVVYKDYLEKYQGLEYPKDKMVVLPNV